MSFGVPSVYSSQADTSALSSNVKPGAPQFQAFHVLPGKRLFPEVTGLGQ